MARRSELRSVEAEIAWAAGAQASSSKVMATRARRMTLSANTARYRESRCAPYTGSRDGERRFAAAGREATALGPAPGALEGAPVQGAHARLAQILEQTTGSLLRRSSGEA